MFKKATLTVVGTILLTLFTANAVAGLLTVYDLEWCQRGVFCVEAWKMLWAALEITLIASFAAAVCTWMLRAMLADKRSTLLVAIGLVSSASLFMTLNLALDIKAVLAAQFFPYVIALRFGFLGMFIVWGTFSLIVCAVVIAAVVRIDNLTNRSRADAR